MEIIKAFQNNEIGINITIKGTYEEPLFRMSDIGSILEMTNIRVISQNFDETEKVVMNAYTPGGEQQVTFLTEKGLYQVLFTSRKPIAKQFKNWVCEVIKEIRLNKVYEYENKLKEKDLQRQKIIMDNFEGKKIVYIGYADKKSKIGKAGYSDYTNKRLNQHKATYDPDFTYEYVYESVYNREIEREIFKHPLVKSKMIKKEYAGQTRVELIQFDDDLSIENLNDIVLDIKKKIEEIENNRIKDEEILRLKLRIEELEKKEEKKTNEDLKKENVKLKKEKEEVIDEEVTNLKKENTKLKKEKEVVRDKTISDLKNSLSKAKGERRYYARNITTGEIKEFDSYEAARYITRIGTHSLRDCYLNQRRQCRGWVFHEIDKPCWRPPQNFAFNPDQKHNASMKMCKSVHKETGEITYYNSVVEAAWYLDKITNGEFANNETNRRTINKQIIDNRNGKPQVSYNKHVDKFIWSNLLENECGEMVEY